MAQLRLLLLAHPLEAWLGHGQSATREGRTERTLLRELDRDPEGLIEAAVGRAGTLLSEAPEATPILPMGHKENVLCTSLALHKPRAESCLALLQGRCGPMSSAEQPQPAKPVLQECLPKAGLVYSEKGNLSEVLCKPKILPIKSITLEKLEQMEATAAKGQPPGTASLSMDT